MPNILEQIIQAKRRANVQRSLTNIAQSGIQVRHVSRSLKPYLRKSTHVWCPNCQQWAHPRIGVCCWECGHVIPELLGKWEAKTK